jgi:predicted nucleotidyltransferase component of viral defense system
LKKPVSNTAASVRARLLNVAATTREDYNVLLVRYALERLLYRLSVSKHRNRFVLKGAMLFVVWRGALHRATRDLDLLGFGDPAPTAVEEAMRELCAVVVDDDGLVFDPASVRAEAIRPEEEYGGVRVTLRAMLGTAKLDLQVDVGFGDAITPAAVETSFPSILGQKPALIKAYPRETVVAEKIEAIVSRGLLNSRLKDYYDLLFLAESYAFKGTELVDAVRATLGRRKTAVPSGIPEGLSQAYASDPIKQSMWSVLIKKSGLVTEKHSLPEVVGEVSKFVLPVLEAAHGEQPFNRNWAAGGPWR